MPGSKLVQTGGREGQDAGLQRQHAGLQREHGGGGGGTYRAEDCHRVPTAGRQGLRDGETNLVHQEQRPTPVALGDRGPQVPGSQALLPPVLHRNDEPHQY